MNARTIKHAFFLILILTMAAAAQILKPKEIIYSRLPTNPQAPAQGTNQPTIWVVGQDGANDRFITYGTKPRISDDGRFLLFNRFTRAPGGWYNPFGGYADFIVRDLSTGQETVIRELNFDTAVGGMSFSPESNQGAYEIIADNSSFIYKFNRDGTNLFQFPWEIAEYVYDDFPAVRRGDQLIAFSNNSLPNGGLYTLGITGLPRQKIPNTSCGDFHPAWSNDNQYITFGSLAVQCFNGNYPDLGLYPYWVANIFKIKPDGTGRQQLSNFPASPNCSLNTANCLTLGYVWTQDNSKIIAAGRINGAKGLFAFDANSGAFTQIPISNGNAPEFVGGIIQTRVDRNVLSIGGGITASTQYTLVSTIGEPVAGQTSSGGTYDLASGFWTIPIESRKTSFDFDGDGKTEVGIFRPAPAEWWYSRSSDNIPRAAQFGASSDKLVPGDFTGDGKADIAVFRPGSGEWFILRSEDGSFLSFYFGTAGDIPLVGDFDGDGKADPTVFRPSSATWFILKSTGGTTITNFGTNGDLPVIADYDGDGKADIAIFRPASGEWWINRSSTGLTIAFQFGNSSDKVVSGDYTGDGKADAAFFRPSNGFWYILRSEDSSFYSVPFGTSDDIPAPGDYDGDGKFDTAVFRPTGSTWFINRSSAGISIVNFGTNGDRPIPSAFIP